MDRTLLFKLAVAAMTLASLLVLAALHVITGAEAVEVMKFVVPALLLGTGVLAGATRIATAMQAANTVAADPEAAPETPTRPS